MPSFSEFFGYALLFQIEQKHEKYFQTYHKEKRNKNLPKDRENTCRFKGKYSSRRAEKEKNPDQAKKKKATTIEESY